MPDMVYLNGKYMPLSEAKIAVTDYGFLFGYGLYETMRAYHGRLFRLKDHLERLGKAARTLNLPCDAAELEKAVPETLRRSGVEEARVRLSLTAGEGSLTPDPRTCRQPTVLVTVIPYIPFTAEIYQRGFSLLTSAIFRNSRSRLPGMKTTCFLENMLARQQAREGGADEALLLNEKGELAEASSSNLFLVSGGVLITPAIESGILPGITRKIVLELAEGLGIRNERTIMWPQELEMAEEAFLTNSLIEVMPVTVIDSQPVGKGRPGALTQQLQAAYERLVAKEIG
jgi:branched-chain amino acid aminotransferase